MGGPDPAPALLGVSGSHRRAAVPPLRFAAPGPSVVPCQEPLPWAEGGERSPLCPHGSRHGFLHKIYMTIYLVIKTDPPPPAPGID